MSGTSLNLTNNFLIAMPNMDDPTFIQSVTYICEHTDAGALGIVINRPTTIKLSEVLEQMQIKVSNLNVAETPILYGGPIHQERGFVIHPPFGEWRSSFATSDEVIVTTSRDILESIATTQAPEKLLIALGFAGWEAGQLEAELVKNTWLTCPANTHVLFDIPFTERWRAAASLIGVDFNALSGESGHA
ncbi:MAG: YqgE/AlgH family protein [Gammaproteobacteria bacterium]